MKILMVNKFLYYRGGAETYFLKIGKYLEEQGHEVQYFGMQDEKNVVGNQCNLYTENMDFHTSSWKKLLYPFRIIYSFDAAKKIKKIIREFKPDIIHLNNINFQLTPSIIEAAASLKVPVVQTVHDYQMLCPNHLMYSEAYGGVCERCIHGSKWNCAKGNCIHGSKVKSILGSVEALLYKAKKTYEKVDTYICPSQFMEKKLQENPIFAGKTIAKHNFIEMLPALEKQSKDKYVLYFGRLSEEKGLDIFLEVCKALPEIPFVIAGSGPMEEQCKNIPNVDFVGFKVGEELNQLIADAYISVYPSIWYENCPLSVLESEMLGTPVLASKLGGIPELILENETGVLIEKLTVDGMKNQIAQLYKAEEKVEYMSRKCLENRENLVTLDEYCNFLVEIYGKMV